MSGRHQRRDVGLMLAILGGVAVAATAAVAQRPAEHRVMERRPIAARAALRRPGARPLMARQAVGPVYPQAPALLAHPDVNVEVKHNDDGVTILVTSQKEEVAERIRQELPDRIEWLRKLGDNARRSRLRLRAQARGPQGMGPQPEGRLREGANVTTQPVEDGLAIAVTSDDPERAEIIKAVLPKRIEAMRHFAAGAQALRESVQAHPHAARVRDWLGLVLSEDVAVTATDTENGVIVELTSENPDEIRRLQEAIHERLEGMQQLHQKLEARRGLLMPMRAMERAELAPLPSEPPRRMRRHMRGGIRAPEAVPQQEHARLREIIRQEIRRYLEDAAELE